MGFKKWHACESGHTYTCRPIKVEMPNLVTYPNQTHVFESYVMRCGSKNEYHKDMCIKAIGLCTQILTILGLIVNTIVGTYMTMNLNTGILALLMNMIFIWVPSTYEEIGFDLDLERASRKSNHLRPFKSHPPYQETRLQKEYRRHTLNVLYVSNNYFIVASATIRWGVPWLLAECEWASTNVRMACGNNFYIFKVQYESAMKAP